MITRKIIGEQLKIRREAINITQNDLTAKTGLTRKQIISIEKGTSDYRIDTFIRYLQGINGSVFIGFQLDYTEGIPLRINPATGLISVSED